MSQSENNLYVYFRKIIITSNNSNWEVKCISLFSSAFVVTKRQCCLFQFSPWCETQISDLKSESFFSILHICSQTNKLHLLLLVHFYLTLTLLTWRIWWASNNASKWQMGFHSAFKGLITVDYSLSIISVKAKFHKISHCQHVYDFG
jgi:hypothetical protein